MKKYHLADRKAKLLMSASINQIRSDGRRNTYKKGYLKVPGGHRLFYELYGNPKVKPVLFVHGGPGAGFCDRDKRFFDPKKFNVLFIDQRGAGRSKPFGNLRANTTNHLIEDLRRFLDFLNIPKVFLFGGSWGSTLSLLFAIRYPKRVSGMLIRGIFLATKREMDHYLRGGVKPFFPEIWERFVSQIPPRFQKNIASYYLKQMLSKNRKRRNHYAFEWAYYEISILKVSLTEKEKHQFRKEFSYRSLSLLESYYMKHHCFIAENFILKNAKKIASIPTTIIHGRYDMICPPLAAYELHKKLPRSKLIILPAGHSSSEPLIEKNLITEIKSLTKQIKYGL